MRDIRLVDKSQIVDSSSKIRSRTALFWVITQRIVIIPYRHFETTYWSLLEVQRNPRKNAKMVLENSVYTSFN